MVISGAMEKLTDHVLPMTIVVLNLPEFDLPNYTCHRVCDLKALKFMLWFKV